MNQTLEKIQKYLENAKFTGSDGLTYYPTVDSIEIEENILTPNIFSLSGFFLRMRSGNLTMCDCMVVRFRISTIKNLSPESKNDVIWNPLIYKDQMSTISDLTEDKCVIKYPPVAGFVFYSDMSYKDNIKEFEEFFHGCLKNYEDWTKNNRT